MILWCICLYRNCLLEVLVEVELEIIMVGPVLRLLHTRRVFWKKKIGWTYQFVTFRPNIGKNGLCEKF